MLGHAVLQTTKIFCPSLITTYKSTTPIRRLVQRKLEGECASEVINIKCFSERRQQCNISHSTKLKGCYLGFFITGKAHLKKGRRKCARTRFDSAGSITGHLTCVCALHSQIDMGIQTRFSKTFKRLRPLNDRDWLLSASTQVAVETALV